MRRTLSRASERGLPWVADLARRWASFSARFLSLSPRRRIFFLKSSNARMDGTSAPSAFPLAKSSSAAFARASNCSTKNKTPHDRHLVAACRAWGDQGDSVLHWTAIIYDRLQPSCLPCVMVSAFAAASDYLAPWAHSGQNHACPKQGQALMYPGSLHPEGHSLSSAPPSAGPAS